PQAMAEVVSALEAYLERYRHAFEELLRAPSDHPVAVGAEQLSEPTDLGLGAGQSADTTAPLTGDGPRRTVRVAAVAALAGLALVGLVAAGALLARERAETRTAAAPAPPPPPLPAAAPAAPEAAAAPV